MDLSMRTRRSVPSGKPDSGVTSFEGRSSRYRSAIGSYGSKTCTLAEAGRLFLIRPRTARS